jgi:hypothetical protein
MNKFILLGLSFFLAACSGLSQAAPQQRGGTAPPPTHPAATTLPETGREESQSIQPSATAAPDAGLEEEISLAPVPLAQEAIDACPVTLPNQKAPPDPSALDFDLGNDAGTLFTIPWPGGVVLFTPTGAGYKAPDGSLSMKWPWYRTVPGDVIIAGRRLDADAAPMPTITLRGEEDGYGETGFHPSGLTWPGEGCWEVTAQAGAEQLTFVTLVVNAPFEPRWPYWLPEGLTVRDLKVRTSPWAIQEIYRSLNGSGELIIETSLDAGEKLTSEEKSRPVAVRGGQGACVQGSRDEAGQPQPEADTAALTWQEVDYSYTIRQTGLGLSCEDLVKIAGP